jgi:hypothetical protein
MSRPTATLASAVLLIAAVTACGAIGPTLQPVASLEGLPQERLVRIDEGVEIAADNRTITIRFVGGPILPPDDVCYTAYVGWARLVGQRLDLAVVQVADVHPPAGTGCAAIGIERMVTVVLATPFLGSTAQDLSDGHALAIDRPQRAE